MDNVATDTQLGAGEWTLDTSASSVGFEVKLFLGMKAKGRFHRYEGTVNAGATAAESAVVLTVWTDSVDTGMKMRDGHLRAPNVFACEQFPTLEFRSTSIVETPEGAEINGTLRVRDVSQPATLHAVRSTGPGAPRYTARRW